MTLEVELRAPEGAADGTPVAVLLHGRGSNRHDLPQLQPYLPAGTAVLAPEAPHPGAPWGYGPGSAWYRYVADDRVVPDTLADSLRALDGLLGGPLGGLPDGRSDGASDALSEALGFEPGPVLLGGFSQGGTTSLAWALTRPERAAARLAGVAVFSGFMADAPGVLDPAALERGALGALPPIFWGHGTRDPAIPFELGTRGRRRLTELGVDLTTWDGPIGHQISGDELDALGRWMTERGLTGGAGAPGG